MNERSVRIVAIEGDAVGTVWTKTCGVGIGRSPDNLLAFPTDGSLQPHHASLLFTGTEWLCRPYPPGPTYVDDEVIDQTVVVRSGSIVRCGTQAFRVVYWEAGTEYEGSLMQQLDRSLTESAQDKVSGALREFLSGRE